jgi:hypothetical protein
MKKKWAMRGVYIRGRAESSSAAAGEGVPDGSGGAGLLDFSPERKSGSGRIRFGGGLPFRTLWPH